MQSVLRSLRVLEVLSERQPVGVNELARICALPPSTTQRILLTLADAGWIRPTEGPSPRWLLTGKALIVGRRAQREAGIRELAHAPMIGLRDTTHETINLVLLDEGVRTVMIDRVDSDQAVRSYSELGQVRQLHATAGGRAMLAALTDDEIEAIVAAGLNSYTQQTVTNPDELRADIRQIREKGYAVNIGQNRLDVCSVGAAVLDRRGRPVAAISMSMPDSRWDDQREREWGALVSAAAADVSSGLSVSSAL